MPRPPAPCGTYAAYQRHKRRSEPVDPACQEASRQHVARHRATNTAYRNKERRYQRITNAAQRQLAREYPARFIEIFDALMAIDQTNPARSV